MIFNDCAIAYLGTSYCYYGTTGYVVLYRLIILQGYKYLYIIDLKE
jgi:hypothetical protein